MHVLGLGGASLLALCLALGLLLRSAARSGDRRERPPSFAVTEAAEEEEEPDYVIVGSGSTGSVLAGRLADAGFSVLLLEAGGGSQAALGGCAERSHLKCPYLPGPGEANLTVFDVPLEWTEILSNPYLRAKYEWDLEKARENTSLPSCARAVGGCGVHNAMIYMRGTPEDFAPGSAWAAQGWDWATVLEAYKRSENNSNFPAGEHHSTAGPIQISMVQEHAQAPASKAFLKACVEAGFPRNPDFNGEARAGCGLYQFLIRDGVRDSAAKAFIGDANHSLLELRPYSHATRIVLTSPPTKAALRGTVGVFARPWDFFWSLLGWPAAADGLRAVGVEYIDGATGARTVVRSKREVILSAGAVNTPKLLMLSGIGRAAELGRLAIPSVLEAPAVGENMMDGVYVIAQFSLRDAQNAWEHCSRLSASPVCRAAAAQYKANPRRGVFTSPGFSSGLFLRSPYAEKHTAAPDVQVTFHPWDKFQRNWTAFLEERAATRGLTSNASSSERGKKHLRLSVVTLEISNNHARSVGAVKLRSADPLAPPVVDSSYLKDESDALPLWWALGEVRKVMQAMDAEELLPGPELNHSRFMDYLKCGYKSFRPKGEPCDSSYLAVNHLGGTARMGKVVDGPLRVQGVAGLRVADASVMPTLPSGNTHASCMMIGERAAELVLAAAAEREEEEQR